MTPGSPHPVETRERLLDAAERLFAERGFAGTSVREITVAAVANLGAVNYYFRSKESLYAEVFARRAAQLRDPMAAVTREAAAIAAERPEEALRAVGRVFLAPHKNRETSRRLIGLFVRESAEQCLPAGFLANELHRPTLDAFAGVLRQMRGELTPGQALACAHSFFAQLMHIVKGAGSALGSVDAQLEHAVRFTTAAVRHIEGAPRARSHSPS